MAERPDIEEHHANRRGGGQPNAYAVVELFEQRIAAFTGAPFAVATDSCTSALTLCCDYLRVDEVTLPAHTYCSVPMAVIHARGRVRFVEREWSGVYQLEPYPVWDCAKRLRAGMFRELPPDPSNWRYACLSLHIKKSLPVGRGGVILTDNPQAAEWFRIARRDGRTDTNGRACAVIIGRNCYLTPEQAARGLMLFDVMPAGGFPDQDELGGYPDLREMPAFKNLDCGYVLGFGTDVKITDAW